MRTAPLSWPDAIVRGGLTAIAVLGIAQVGCSSDDTATERGSCALPPMIEALGPTPARHANECGVPRSMGQKKWYRLSATLPGDVDHVVQLELWQDLGAFAGTTVHAGTFPITGADAALATCGVCVRALAAKGTSAEQELFAIAGTVEVRAVGGDGAELSAALRELSFVQLDPESKQPLEDGCTSQLASIELSGTVVAMGGGGGGGGSGGNNCPLIIGD